MENMEIPEGRLLAAVVALAVRDACGKPLGNPAQPTAQAINAIDFLFRRDAAGLDSYAVWLGFDAGQFRTRLLGLRDRADFTRLNEFELRALRFNHRAWLDGAHRQREVFEEDEPAELPLAVGW